MGNLFTFPRTVDPLAGMLTPEELQQQEILNGFETGRRQGFVPAMVGALDVMRRVMPAQDATPTPRAFSGGDVIGLMPEQTTALLDRAQRSNEIDQRMYEGRQAEMREEQRVREGRILTARDAEARRKQELAIEQARIDRDAAEERRRRMQPEVSLVPGNPEYSQRKTFNPQTNMPEIEVFKTPGVAMPADPLKPVLVNTVVDGKPVQMFVTPEVGKVYDEQAPTPDANAQLNLRRGLMNDFMGLEIFNGETGKYEPVDQEMANLMTENFIANNGRVSIGDDATMKVRKPEGSQSRMVVVTDKNGAKSLQPAEAGMEIAPAKEETSDPFKYMKDTHGINWKKDLGKNIQKYANSLAAKGYTAEEIEAVLGPRIVNKSSLVPGSTEMYTLPEAAVAAPVAALPDGVPQGSTPIMYGGKPAWQTPDGKVVLE